MTILEDGQGSGKKQKVNAENRAAVAAITQSELAHSTERNGRFNINTGDVSLTSDNASAVLYLKNNETTDIHINTIIVILGASTGGSGDASINAYKNPTGGTIISSPTDVDININQNFGSNDPLIADVYKGAEAKTLTGGDLFLASRQSAGGIDRIVLDSIILPKGTELGVTITPPTGNTNMDVQIALALYLKDFST